MSKAVTAPNVFVVGCALSIGYEHSTTVRVVTISTQKLARFAVLDHGFSPGADTDNIDCAGLRAARDNFVTVRAYSK